MARVLGMRMELPSPLALRNVFKALRTHPRTKEAGPDRSAPPPAPPLRAHSQGVSRDRTRADQSEAEAVPAPCGGRWPSEAATLPSRKERVMRKPLGPGFYVWRGKCRAWPGRPGGACTKAPLFPPRA